MSQTKTENWRQEIEKLNATLKAEKTRLFSFLDANFTTKTTVAPEGYHIGHLTCRHCGHEYIWNDWGRYMTRAFTFAVKHINRKHYDGKHYSPIVTNNWVFEWFETQEEARK